jgi:hypothetical protein
VRTLPARSVAWPIFILLTALALAPATTQGAASGDVNHDSVVLLELFTSQGCSSCPPADRLLSRLGHEPSLAGRVLPLAFHVDYWNRLGWKDPFSSPAWSARQRDYAARIPGESVYTPQLVIDGRVACVGSDERTARRLIRAAIAQPARAILEPRRAKLTATGIDLDIQVDFDPAGTAGRPVLFAVVYSNDRSTRVTAGENANRTLHNDYVVRRLTRLATIPGAGSHDVSGHIDWPPGVTRESLGAAVFLQHPSSGHVFAAHRVPLPSP